ncbi:MAG: SsrA-binding protein SmpB [Flavobacteriales bacterium]|jgi:SsrA-binding protein|uniref:SsrA-binding protein SmpB n=1 Tax=Blattabacterium sp. (Mastotermes darwiniensis) TaxID=39768 RepID=UPI000231DFAB|nr:SsrA-binding protein SmpB [Blattabacterium sp. (Mastotermes darwiniensis)]AER40451.1 SsrA-binding protein [Blattabacterium sp. (Mastotermes darwiniensis) str. MADAR]MDR1805033.1 SsrA-binding protein SmpB [Flavobacteriales bacterium]
MSIINKKARFQYQFLEEYIAGIQLLGTEVKSIRQNRANITESFCQIKNGELYSINMYIAEYQLGINHKSKRERKLLLTKKELMRIEKKLKEPGFTIIPTKLFFNDKGYAKVQIFLSKGKKIYDKREFIRKRDLLREEKFNNF